MSDYRVSEKIVKSIFFIVPAIVIIVPCCVTAFVFIVVGYGHFTPVPVRGIPIYSIQNVLQDGEDLYYFKDGEYLISNSDEAKTYLNETISKNQTYISCEQKSDSDLDYSTKLRIKNDSQYYLFYLFQNEDIIGVRSIYSGVSTENLNGYLTTYQYTMGETDYLLHEIMKI